jgi:hypothetical protein
MSAESRQKVVFISEEAWGLSICGLYELRPDFYVRYQTDMFGIRPTPLPKHRYRSASPSATFLDAIGRLVFSRQGTFWAVAVFDAFRMLKAGACRSRWNFAVRGNAHEWLEKVSCCA